MNDAGKWIGKSSQVLILIFSKDRAFQLDGTIRSLLHSARDIAGVRIVVLFKTSAEEHDKSYATLESKFPGISFLRENDFYNQVSRLLAQAAWVLFVVDDTIFVGAFFISSLPSLLDRVRGSLGISLRLGTNTTWCFSYDRPQRIPDLSVLENDWRVYDWTAAESDFGYPLEVSSSFYSCQVIAEAIGGRTYSNPNELEAVLHTGASSFRASRSLLICPEYSVAFSVPLNRIQNSFENRAGAALSSDSLSLNRLFAIGFTIDVIKLFGFVPNGAHQLIDLPMITPWTPGERLKFSLSLSSPGRKSVICTDDLDISALPARDAALVLEALSSLEHAIESSNQPVVAFLSEIVTSRERVVERMISEHSLFRERERRDSEAKTKWLQQQVAAKDNEILNYQVAYDEVRKALKELTMAGELAAKEAASRIEHLSALTAENSLLQADCRSFHASLQKSNAELASLTQLVESLTRELTEKQRDFERLHSRSIEAERAASEIYRALQADLSQSESRVIELSGWARELEAARDWHDVQRKAFEAEVIALRGKTLWRHASERLQHLIISTRSLLGRWAQWIFRLETPPQVVNMLRDLSRKVSRPNCTQPSLAYEVEPDDRGIVLFLPFLVLGGAERVLSQIVAALASNGFTITVVTSVRTDASLGSSRSWFAPNVRDIVELSCDSSQEARNRVIQLISVPSIRAVWLAGSDLAYSLLPEIRMLRPDLKIVDLLFNEVGHTVNNRRMAALIDLHIAENKQVAAWLERNGEIPERIRLIPNGVDLAQFKPNPNHRRSLSQRPDGFVVGYLGRLSHEKGPDIFLKIAAELKVEERLFFCIAGLGPLDAPLREEAASLGLNKSVAFLGPCEARSFLCECDLLVIPSRIDGRPNAALEGMAMGVPIVAARVGGLPEIVKDGETGVLCESGCVEDFSCAIRELAKDPVRLGQFSKAARVKAEQELDHRLMNRKYIELFRGLIAQPAE